MQPNANAGNTVVVAGIRFGQARANYRPEELHRKFLDALPTFMLEKAEDIASQQHGISFEDMQKAIQNALAQQKTEYHLLLEKQKADFQSTNGQQTKRYLHQFLLKIWNSFLIHMKSANPFPDTLTREEIMRVVAKAYGPPPKPQKPEKLQSSRIDRLESKINEIGSNDI
ncbi:unnamed protein product [Rhizophagus irregularis]|nr:unnamed protein product [Rhizophagus irregularis]